MAKEAARRPRLVNKPKVRSIARKLASELKKLKKEKAAVEKILAKLNDRDEKLRIKIADKEAKFHAMDELYSRDW